MKPTILIAASGAGSEAHRLLDEALRLAFPDHRIAWGSPSRSAWGSPSRSAGLPSLHEAFAGFKQEGIRQVVVCSLHLTPGEQHQTVLGEDPQDLQLVHTGPLLASEQDLPWMAERLVAELPPDRPVLLVAHGSTHTPASGDLLTALADRMALGPELLLTRLRGERSPQALERFILQARSSGKLHVVPLFLAAGRHVRMDLLGHGPESLRSRLDVPDCTWGPVLGERAWVRARLIDKIRTAISEFQNISY